VVTGYCVVTTTAPSREVAGAIADALLEQRLAACIQVFPIESVYRWQGQRTEETEYLLFIKTREALYEQVQALVRSVHPYEVPEILSLPVTAGLPDYLAWISEVT
jgi:periplasmic divalent cation tolerance protein